MAASNHGSWAAAAAAAITVTEEDRAVSAQYANLDVDHVPAAPVRMSALLDASAVAPGSVQRQPIDFVALMMADDDDDDDDDDDGFARGRMPFLDDDVDDDAGVVQPTWGGRTA
jgi:hypothetical protein